MNFHFDHVQVIEFGVGSDDGGEHFYAVAVDGDVQEALRQMALATWTAMQNVPDGAVAYEAAEKYGSIEHLVLPLDDPMAERLRTLHEAEMLDMNNDVLSEPYAIFCYFIRMIDREGRRLTALRRATQFKGILRSRLIRFHTDALKIVPDNVFKLDSDFDLLMDSENVHILRPSGFEFIGQVQDAVLAAVPHNVGALRVNLPFVDFTAIEAYASTRPRAARYIASIRSQRGTDGIEREALVSFCRKTGVEVVDDEGIVTVDDRHVMGFLEVLDRRRYEVDLVREVPEQYRAASRQRLTR